MAKRITFALPKGRILKDAAPLLAACGLSLDGVAQSGDRRLQSRGSDAPACTSALQRRAVAGFECVARS